MSGFHPHIRFSRLSHKWLWLKKLKEFFLILRCSWCIELWQTPSWIQKQDLSTRWSRWRGTPLAWQKKDTGHIRWRCMLPWIVQALQTVAFALLTGKTSLSRLPVAVLAMYKFTQARLMEFGSCWSQSNCLAKLLRRLNWIRLSGDTLGAGNGAGRSKKLEPLCWKPLGSSWLKWLNCRNVVVVKKLKTQEKNRNSRFRPNITTTRPYRMVIINDFGVTIGNRQEIVFFAINTIKTVQMSNCNFAATDVGTGRFPTRRVVYPLYTLNKQSFFHC